LVKISEQIYSQFQDTPYGGPLVGGTESGDYF